MAYEWFGLLNSFRLGKRTKLDDEKMLANWRTWSIGCIINIKITGEKIYHAKVDAIPLLYEFIAATVSMCTKGEFDVLIGEGFWMEGRRTVDSIDIKIAFEAGRNADVLLTRSLSNSDALLFLISKSGDIVRSLEELEVDLERSVLEFPTTEYRRGT
jgi:hypothetical protein